MGAGGRTDLYEVPLDDVGLPRRALSLLGGRGIAKVGQILEMGDKELLALKGFGPKTLEDVKEALRAFVAGAPEAEVVVAAEPAGVETVTEEIVEAPTDVEEIVEAEEDEGDVVIYEAPKVEAVVDAKPQIRFKEDIFGETVRPASGGGKKGKKKKSRDDRQEQGKEKKAKKTRAVTVDTVAVDEDLDLVDTVAVDEDLDLAE